MSHVTAVRRRPGGRRQTHRLGGSIVVSHLRQSPPSQCSVAYCAGVEIRQCRTNDIALLEQWIPTGLTQTHAARFSRQEQGTSTFLIAWLDGTPVGSCEIRWSRCRYLDRWHYLDETGTRHDVADPCRFLIKAL